MPYEQMLLLLMRVSAIQPWMFFLYKALTSLIFCFLCENFEIQEPGFQPRHHKRGDRKNVTKSILTKQLRKTRGNYDVLHLFLWSQQYNKTELIEVSLRSKHYVTSLKYYNWLLGRQNINYLTSDQITLAMRKALVTRVVIWEWRK